MLSVVGWERCIGARFNGPWGVAVDARGRLYVCESGNNLIRRIDP